MLEINARASMRAACAQSFKIAILLLCHASIVTEIIPEHYAACSVFAIHYKYIAEALEKNIRSTEFSSQTFGKVLKRCDNQMIRY